MDISVYIVEYSSWVTTIIISHTTSWDCLFQPHFHFYFRFLCLNLRGILNHPYRNLLCLQIDRILTLLILSQLSWTGVSFHTFLVMSGSLVKVMSWLLINMWKLSQR